MSTTTYDPRPVEPHTVETTTLMSGSGTHTHRRISWAAIFGGVILAVTLQITLSFLGSGIGLSQVNLNNGSTPTASSFGIGAGLWWIISSCIALLVGGYVSAWLAGVETRFDGLLHGLITWGIAMMLVLYLLGSAIGGIVGGGFSVLGGATKAAGIGLSGAAQPIAQATGVSPDVLQQQAQAYLQPTAVAPSAMSPQQAQKDVAANLVTYAGGGSGAAAAKARIVDDMAAQMQVSHEQAEQKFDASQAKLQQTRDKAVQDARIAANRSASAAATGSFAAFTILVLGALCAAIGGAVAVQRRIFTTRRTIA